MQCERSPGSLVNIFRSEFKKTESLSNDDGEENESGTKAIGLDWQNIFVRASRFFAHFFAVTLYDYDVKMPNLTFWGT